VNDEQLAAARTRVDRLLAERDQVRRRARATINPAARQTYSCRMLELVGETNAAIEILNGLVGRPADRVGLLEVATELGALAPVATP